jgi:hypothetical protein
MSEGRTIRADHGRWYSAVASSMSASQIREVMELAWKDLDTIHLEVGEPDFPSPDHVIEAVRGRHRRTHALRAERRICTVVARCCLG